MRRPAAPGGDHAVAAGRRPCSRAQDGVVSLEWVLALPLLAIAVMGLLEVVGVARDALVVHEAARAGARAAATSTGTSPVQEAVAASLPERDPAITVAPVQRTAGDVVEVSVSIERRVGPVVHPVSARAVARVEPAVGPANGEPEGVP